jgi:hypothetical protein
MYLGHASVEDFRGVTRGLAPGGLTVRVVRDLGMDGIGDWGLGFGLRSMCVENSLCRIGRGPAWGWAAFSHAGEYRCSRSRESWLSCKFWNKA